MILFQFIWLNFMLIVITSGFTTTSIVLYVVSSIILTFYQININMLITEEHRNLRKGKGQQYDLGFLYDINQNKSRLNISCSFIIHSVLIISQLHSLTALAAIVISFIVRFYTTYRMENVLKCLN